MNSSPQDQQGGIFDINITPFVDVVLVLLVIFMVTAPMLVQQTLKVDLPSSETTDTMESTTLSVAITAQGQYLLNGDLITEQDLQKQAVSAYAQDEQTQVVFAADLDSRHESVVRAMDVMRRAGLTRFAFQVVSQD